ncbi:MAG TPA: MBG domain-containing protein, partial [Puia sp.]
MANSVRPDPLVFSTTTLPNGQYGSSYVPLTLTVTGGNAPYTFAVTGGAMAPGINLSADGTLSGTPLAAGSFTFTVTATDATPSPGENTGTQDLTLVVDQAALTITAANAGKAYGAALPTLSVTYGGFVNGDGAGNLTTPPTLSTTATAASPVNTYPITAGGAADANYTISYTPGTLTVTTAALTITAVSTSKAYGAALPALSVTYGGFVNGDGAGNLATPPTLSTTATAASPVNTYPITAGGAADANYTISYTPGTLTVTPVALTITAANASKAYGAALPTLSVTYGGFVNGDAAGNLTTPPTLSTTATAASPVNTYPITAGGA